MIQVHSTVADRGIKAARVCSLVLFCALICAFCVLSLSCATAPSIEAVKKAEAHNNLGVSYLNRGQVKESLIEFQKAYKLDPTNKDVLNNLGYVNALYKKYDEAISFYKKAISVDHDFSEAMNNLGVVYLDTGQWDEAIKYFKSALDNPIYSTPENAYSNMGYAYYQNGDYKEAEDAANEALMLDPSFHRARFILGLVYVKKDKIEAAISEFRRVIGLMPDYMEAHFELAKAYLAAGRKNKALKHFMYIVEKDENPERRREASAYIESLKY